jgi:BNR/Asp-box repeat
MNNLGKQVRMIISLMAIVGLSPPIAAQEIKIREGTALARLVAEVTRHAPEMALAASWRGKIDIPPWLAAHYRRNHSEIPKVAIQLDPTGGYPMALESLYVWMLRHQDLQPSPAPEFRAAVTPSVGQNLRISGASDTPRSESDIRVNFNNPLQIISASNNIGIGRQAHFFSADGGASWGQTTLPLLTGDSLHSDPTVDWTSDGTAWTTTIGINADSTVLQMRAYKSTDGGKNWIFDGTFSGDQTSADKQMMWVDRSQTSPFRDRIYVIWHNGAPAYVSYRTAAGWHAPIRLSGAETTGTAIGSDITTNASGNVFAVWPDTGSKSLFFAKSTDGGNNFTSPPGLIARTLATFQISVPAFAKRSALVGVSIAALNNNVYVSWLDLSGDDGCKTPGSEPAGNVDSDCKSRVWFARSTDGGQTWSEPAQINPGSSRTDQFSQKLAVDPETGVLGIVYYSTGTGPDRNKTNLMFQFSTDGGKTWSKQPTQITTATTDETTVEADNGNQYGDYNGLSVVKGIFFPSWTDRRDNGSESIFTAKITVRQSSPGVFEAVLLASAGGIVPGPK